MRKIAAYVFIGAAALTGSGVYSLEGGGTIAEAKTHERYLELACVGRGILRSSRIADLEIEQRTPNMVVKGAEGKFVFTNPESMCTVRVPGGRRADLKVTLERIEAKFLNGNCHYLQITGDNGDTRSMSPYSEYIMNNVSSIDFFPQINQRPGEIGRPVGENIAAASYDNDSGWGAGELHRAAESNGGVVDFSATYTVNITIESEY